MTCNTIITQSKLYEGEMIDILYNKLGSLNDLSLAEWKDVEPLIFNRHTQRVHEKLPEVPIPLVVQEVPIVPEQPVALTVTPAKKKVSAKEVKSVTIKPLEIIANETTAFHNSTDHIKDALITFITKDEFSKIFGMTKCAEIMSGIVNNRWNKSTALFISFFLDKEVYYNDKVIIYNKDKNKGRITI
uniref:Uncharacterized protein n=1 Tax=viral metagenome TaxID=1070528 RepID=A0A6C0LHF9_9ZZZZ